MFASLFRRQDARIAATLYAAAVNRARAPVFYRELGIADTMDGRFDMVTLQVVLLLHRFKGAADPRIGRLSQGVFDTMFADMDRSLRELSVGDDGVKHRVKKMGQAFYGRLNAYDAALADSGDDSLVEALQRNLYRGREVAPAVLAAMAADVRAQAAALAAAPLEIFAAGTLPSAPFPQEVPA